MVARPGSADEVAAVVAYARERGLRVAVQAEGHSAGPLAGMGEDTLLLKTGRMAGAEIDVENRRARVGAAAKWQDVSALASPRGLAGLSGSSAEVGVVGYTLGGGHGWLAREHGLACNSVVGAEVVTAKGELVHADHENESDLFWALRGGGGNFGVVTALEFELCPSQIDSQRDWKPAVRCVARESRCHCGHHEERLRKDVERQAVREDLLLVPPVLPDDLCAAFGGAFQGRLILRRVLRPSETLRVRPTGDVQLAAHLDLPQQEQSTAASPATRLPRRAVAVGKTRLGRRSLCVGNKRSAYADIGSPAQGARWASDRLTQGRPKHAL